MGVKVPKHAKGCTFIQATTPSVAEPGDTWFNTTNLRTYIYRETEVWDDVGEVRNLGADYGYAASGFDGTNRVSIIDRITFPFNSGTASHVGNLSGSRGDDAGCDGTDFVSLFLN